MFTQLIRVPVRYLAMFVVLFGTLLVGSSTAYAQTTGSLQGTVLDEDGLEVPGVTVTLTGATLIGGAQESTTDGRGYYRFIELLPGVYTVTAVKGGFRTVTLEGVQVNINRTTTNNITMRLGEEAEVVDVVGQQVVDTESTTVGQVLTKDFLQRIPTGRTYQQAVRTATGVTGGSNPNMGGSASNENTYMLDGATITDPVTGTFSLNFNYDAIQQIEVLLGGYEPEYGISLGGIVNLVTESGTNNLEFDTSVFYTNGNWFPKKDARFTADGFQLGPSGFDQQFQTLQVAGKVSGPIVRDKAWFVLSYQHSRSLIATTGTPQRRDFDGHYVLSKLTVQPTSEHRLSILLQTNPTSIDNILQGNPFVKDEAQGRQAQGGFVAQARWQWFLTPEVNLDTRLSLQKIYIEQGAVPCTHNRDRDQHPCRPGEMENEVDWLTPGRIGIFGAFDSVNWGSLYLDDRWTFNASTKASVLGITDPLGGTHDFKFGVETRQFINDYINGYSGNKLYYDLNESQFDPTTLSNYYWIETSGAFRSRQSGSTWNFFLQDSYKPVSNLTIKYGTRFDSTVLRNDIGEPTITGNLFGPRLYAAWDPFGDQKTKIAGGWGRFNDSGRQAVASFTNINAFASKLWLGEFFDGGGIDNPYVASSDQVYSVSPRVNTSSANESLRLPSLDEFILLFQRQIVPDVALGADLSARFTRHLYEYDELNLIYDEDGSAIIGARTGDPAVSYARLRTPREARRNYYRATVSLAKVQSRRWAANASYSFVFSNGTSLGSLSGSFANDPQTRYNYGPIFTSQMHQVKAQGYWQLPTDPWTQTIGFFLEYISGEPIERRYWGDGFGGGYSIRIRNRSFYTQYPDVWFMNLKFQQEFDVRKGKLIADIELRNLLNNRAGFGVLTNFVNQENRMLIASRQDPLRIQLGIRYQF
ncbi:MAG: TonB-dependent receptor [Myxococcota bacterium]